MYNRDLYLCYFNFSLVHTSRILHVQPLFCFFGKKCIYSYRQRFKSCYQQMTTRNPETITLKITWISGSLKAGAQSYNQLWNLETRTRTKPYQFRRIWKWLYWMSASNEPAYGNFDWIRCLCVILSSNAMFYIHYVGLIHNNREYDGYTSHFHYNLILWSNLMLKYSTWLSLKLLQKSWRKSYCSKRPHRSRGKWRLPSSTVSSWLFRKARVTIGGELLLLSVEDPKLDMNSKLKFSL